MMTNDEYDTWYWRGWEAYWAGINHIFDATEEQREAWECGWDEACDEDGNLQGIP
jgi:hypothetical protein